MRQFYSCLVPLAILFLLCSCGDDDDDDVNVDPIVGKWKSVTFSLTDCESGIPDIESFSCGSCILQEFAADGTFKSTISTPGEINETITGQYTLTGSVLTTCDGNNQNCEDSTITLSDDSLVLEGTEDGCILTVDFERG